VAHQRESGDPRRLPLSPHTRRCFLVRERLLHAGGAQAWVEAQPLFLYPLGAIERQLQAN
jgi:aminoacrylate hydrolase